MMRHVLDALLLFAVVGAWWEIWRVRRAHMRVKVRLDEALKALDQAMKVLMQEPPPNASPDTVAAPAPRAASQIARILQMKRQGLGHTEIARELGVPRRQVDLVVKLHMERAGARRPRR